MRAKCALSNRVKGFVIVIGLHMGTYWGLWLLVWLAGL